MAFPRSIFSVREYTSERKGTRVGRSSFIKRVRSFLFAENRRARSPGAAKDAERDEQERPRPTLGEV